MNVERILALADIIEAQPHTRIQDGSGFNMLLCHHNCGTPSCIAGFAAAQSSKEKIGVLTFKLASDWFGSTPKELFNLFEPYEIKDWNKITPAQAATTLRKLAATGVVDWSHVNEVQS